MVASSFHLHVLAESGAAVQLSTERGREDCSHLPQHVMLLTCDACVARDAAPLHNTEALVSSCTTALLLLQRGKATQPPSLPPFPLSLSCLLQQQQQPVGNVSVWVLKDVLVISPIAQHGFCITSGSSDSNNAT